jgi:hypothetical protein
LTTKKLKTKNRRVGHRQIRARPHPEILKKTWFSQGTVTSLKTRRYQFRKIARIKIIKKNQKPAKSIVELTAN